MASDCSMKPSQTDVECCDCYARKIIRVYHSDVGTVLIGVCNFEFFQADMAVAGEWSMWRDEREKKKREEEDSFLKKYLKKIINLF